MKIPDKDVFISPDGFRLPKKEDVEAMQVVSLRWIAICERMGWDPLVIGHIPLSDFEEDRRMAEMLHLRNESVESFLE